MKEIWTTLTQEGGLLRVRAAMALTMTGVVAYSFITDGAIPSELLDAWIIVAGFYFVTRAR